MNDFSNATPLNSGKQPRHVQLKSVLYGLDDVAPILENRYLVKGWMDRGALTVAYGESNVGKTFFALDIALHVAANWSWHGARVEGGLVLYIASEGGHGFKNRVSAIRIENPKLADAANGKFLVLPVTVDLRGVQDTNAILDMLNELDEKPALIIVDTLARSMGDGDENSAPDMSAFVRNMDKLRCVTGAHVLTIHHSGKDSGRGARGHSSLRGAVDTEFQLTKASETIQAEVKKQRDMRSGRVFSYRLKEIELGCDQDGDAVTTCVVEECDPAPKSIKLTGANKIALQALGDALANHGEIRHGEMFPGNRRCVSSNVWRDYCDRHSLSGADSSDAKRVAFNRAKKSLHEKEIIRVVDSQVWRCEND